MKIADTHPSHFPLKTIGTRLFSVKVLLKTMALQNK